MARYKKLSVKLSKLKAAIASIEKTQGPQLDPDISFEYMIGSFFPKVLTEIKKDLHNEHIKGFLEGLEEGKKNDNKGND